MTNSRDDVFERVATTSHRISDVGCSYFMLVLFCHSLVTMLSLHTVIIVVLLLHPLN